ncbi:MAG: PAS domain-containing protein, partial [Methanothrix sp.]
MKRKKPKLDQSSDLRSQAEAHLNLAKSTSAESDNISAESRLLHELQVHQLELEMQNEELLRAKLEAENALAKYSDLYEFAPIGLLTIDPFGRILEGNLTGAKLLGVERNVLLKSRFEQFVVHEDRQALEHSWNESFLTGVKQTCVVRLLQSEGPQIHVRIECTATNDSLVNDKRFRIAVIDVTERVRAEEARQEIQDYLEKLIGYANAPIIVWDTSFKITRFN